MSRHKRAPAIADALIIAAHLAIGLVYAVRGLVRRLAQLKREDLLTLPGGYPLSGVREIGAALLFGLLLWADLLSIDEVCRS